MPLILHHLVPLHWAAATWEGGISNPVYAGVTLALLFFGSHRLEMDTANAPMTLQVMCELSRPVGLGNIN